MLISADNQYIIKICLSINVKLYQQVIVKL